MGSRSSQTGTFFVDLFCLLQGSNDFQKNNYFRLLEVATPRQQANQPYPVGGYRYEWNRLPYEATTLSDDPVLMSILFFYIYSNFLPGHIESRRAH